MTTPAHLPRTPSLLAALTALALSVGCASAPATEESAAGTSAHVAVDALAEALVRDAERRVDTNALRVFVDELHEAREPREDTVRIRMDHGELAAVGRELQRELVVALTSRLHLIDADWARRTLDLPDDAPVEEVARAVGATHALVGTFAPRRDELEVLIRLVDAKNHVIVAAASGILDVDELSDPGRLALTPEERPPVPIIDVPPRPRVASQAPTSTAPQAAGETPAVRSAFRQPQPLEPATAEPASTVVSTSAQTRTDPVTRYSPVSTEVVEVAAGAPAPKPAPVTEPAVGGAVGTKPRAPAPAEPAAGPALRRLRALGRRLDGSRSAVRDREPQ